MADSYTASAFVVAGPWSDATRKNPAMNFLERACIDHFDTGDHSPNADYCTDDFSITTPHAEHFSSGRDHSFAEGIGKIYTTPFSKWSHEPYHQVAIEAPQGWDLYMQSYLYGNVAGEPTQGEEKVKDLEGREWDVKIPLFYHFTLVNEADAKHGMRMSHVTVIKDTGIVNAKLDKRGHGHRKSYKH